MSRHLGAPVTLVPGRRPGGAPKPVLRCHLDPARAGGPETVILKHAPATRAGEQPVGLLNEWAALRFLSELGLDPPLSPAFYGGDPDAGVLLLEDLGDEDSLANVLLGSDGVRAEAALVSFARVLGRMQAAAAPRLGEYCSLRESLGPPGGEAIFEPGELAARFEAALRSAELSLSGAAAGEVDAAIDRVAQPGPFLALVHGDACPSNERLLGGGVVLLDFATAGLRHALLDGVCGRVPFPSCWCARRLTPAVPALMEEAYRAELVRGFAVAADDEAFAAESAGAIAYWLIETTTAALATTPNSRGCCPAAGES
jgi:hypothetical protein